MLAELVENGLQFSSPDVEVEIYGRKTGNRYLLAVVDYGVGMPRDELERARARLRDEENFLVAPTRFLGHYVVGRLARQLDVQVELGDSPVSGITARMLLPAEILSDAPETVAQNGNGRRAERTPATTTPATTTPATTTTATTTTMRAPVPTSAVLTQRMASVPKPAVPETPAPQPVASAASQTHRWPTEQELASQITPNSPVSVATLAESEPYNPLRPEIDSATTRGGSSGSGPDRTRNGLVKRQPRHRGTEPGRPQASPVPARHTVDETGQDRTPAEVSSMLSAFRTGHQRGHQRGQTNGMTAHFPVLREEEPGDH